MQKINIKDLQNQDGNYIRYFQGDITNKLQQVKLTQGISGWEKVRAYTIMPKYNADKLPIENRPSGFANSTDPTLCLILEENRTEYKSANKADMRTKEILFQILFGLYQANATVGISLNSTDTYGKNIYLKPEKKTMHFALQIQNENQYDYFTFESDNTVLIAPQTVQTDANPNLTKIQEYFSEDTEWYGIDSWGSKFLEALGKPDQDYGSGIPWGLNLAFFHPIFKQFYKGEKTKDELPTDTFIFKYGHQRDWLKQDTKVVSEIDNIMKETKQEVEDALKQEKTYKLEEFKDEINGLLKLWDDSGKLTNSNEDQTKVKNELKQLYKSFKNKYSENQVQDLGVLQPFTTNTVANVLLDIDEFNPNVHRATVTEEPYRTRGHVAVFLFLIGKISNPILMEKFQSNWNSAMNINKVSESLYATDWSGRFYAEFGNDTENSYTVIESIFNYFDQEFRGAQKKIEKLREKYAALKKQYDDAQRIIDAQTDRATQNVLLNEKLNAAKDVLDTLDATNINAKESEANNALDEATTEAKGWQNVVDNAQQEQTRLGNNRTRLGNIKTEFNNVNSELSAFRAYYSGKDWNALNDQLVDIANLNSSEFATKMTAFELKLENIKSEITAMEKELAEEREKADALPDVDDRFDTKSITKKSELSDYLKSNSDIFKDENIDVENILLDNIVKDQRKVTGLLHAIWGKEQNNTQAIVRGLNMADL